MDTFKYSKLNTNKNKNNEIKEIKQKKFNAKASTLFCLFIFLVDSSSFLYYHKIKNNIETLLFFGFLVGSCFCFLIVLLFCTIKKFENEKSKKRKTVMIVFYIVTSFLISLCYIIKIKLIETQYELIKNVSFSVFLILNAFLTTLFNKRN